MSSVVPLLEVPRDWLRMMAISMSNQYKRYRASIAPAVSKIQQLMAD
jgi:hypothetical protein